MGNSPCLTQLIAMAGAVTANCKKIPEAKSALLTLPSRNSTSSKASYVVSVFELVDFVSRLAFYFRCEESYNKGEKTGGRALK